MRQLNTFIRIQAGAMIAFIASAHAIAMSVAAYQDNYKEVPKLGGQLRKALPEKYSVQLEPQPILLQPSAQVPSAPVVMLRGDGRQLVLSNELIDLLNRLCHAKAADQVQHGFFAKYLQAFSSGQPAPNLDAPCFLTDDVINDQMSYFNQMIGFIMAINYSHQYLGHYAKYAARLGTDKHPVPINTCLTVEEWNTSLRVGVQNSLTCALSTQGPQILFDAIRRISSRPQWADFIIPPGVDIESINRQLASWETDFFHGLSP